MENIRQENVVTQPMTMVAGRPWLVPLMLDAEKDRDAWVAARVSGIGGSDVSAIVGEHPHKSAIDVWVERSAGAQAFQDNDRTIVGRLLEPVVMRWFEDGAPAWPRDGGPIVIAKPPTVYHRDRPWHRGSADGLMYEPEAVTTIAPPGSVNATILQTRDSYREVLLWSSPLRPVAMVEVKTHGWFASRGYDTTEDGAPISVPADKRIQVAWYQELYEIELAYLVALVDTHIRKTYVIHRDHELGATLLEEASRFWTKNVIGGVPPESDGTERYRTYLHKRFKTHTAELVATTPEVDAATRKLLRTKRAQTLLEDRRERLEHQIKSHIGDALGVRTAHGNVTWKSQRSGKLREKEARAELYKVAGWTNAEIAEFEKRQATPDHRVLRISK